MEKALYYCMESLYEDDDCIGVASKEYYDKNGHGWELHLEEDTKQYPIGKLIAEDFAKIGLDDEVCESMISLVKFLPDGTPYKFSVGEILEKMTALGWLMLPFPD